MVKTKDPQKQAVYDCQCDLCEPLGGEKLGAEATEAVLERLWSEGLTLPLRSPSIRYDTDNKTHTYCPWKHEITFACKRRETPAVHLLHELAHARIAALGIGPFVESHGPFFLREFGRLWSLYSAKGYEKWRRRCESENLRVSEKSPKLSNHPWAVVREDGREYAVRPASRAVEMGWNIANTFTLNVQDNHPMGS